MNGDQEEPLSEIGSSDAKLWLGIPKAQLDPT